MFLLVGLGNPGDRYQLTRHNFGFLTVDYLIEHYKLNSFGNKFDSQVFTGEIMDKKLMIIKPQKYMNCSGSPIQRIMSFYKIPLPKLIVFHDDVDLKLGKVKVKIGGGSGGHNGLKDLDNIIGKDYIRVRLGVGRPENPEYEIADYVLNNFNKDEMNLVTEVNKKISKLISLIMNGDLNGFMNQFVL